MGIGITPHSSRNQEFTNRAHMRARDEIYPLAFNTDGSGIEYLDLPDAKTRDYAMGIDRTLGIKVAGIHEPIRFSVQERFRRPEYAERRDVTLTVKNHNSGQVSELHKIEAAMMLYGYYDDEIDCFIEAILFRVPAFKEYLIRG